MNVEVAGGLILVFVLALAGVALVVWLGRAKPDAGEARGDLDYAQGWRDGAEFARRSFFEEADEYVAGYASGVRAGRKREREKISANCQ